MLFQKTKNSCGLISESKVKLAFYFLLSEIFRFGYYWLIVFGLIALLLVRDYFRDKSTLNNLGLYAPLPLIILFVNYYTARESWKKSERLVELSN